MKVAWFVAIAADAIQLALLPFFFEGAASPFDAVLEVIVSVVLVWLLGWHPALLPALIAELLPGVDLVPSWTASVALVALTRKKVKEPAPAAPAVAPPPREASSAEVVADEPPGSARD